MLIAQQEIVTRQPLDGTRELDPYWKRRFTRFWHFGDPVRWRYDLIAGVAATDVGSGVTKRPYGIRTSGDTTNYLRLPLPFDAACPVSFVIGMRFISGTIPYSLVQEDTTLWYGWYSGGNNLVSSNNNSFDGDVVPIGPTREFGLKNYAFASIAANNLRGCAGGAIVVDTSCAAPTGTQTSVVLGAIFSSAGAGLPAVAEFTHLGIFNGALQDPELIALSQNPWQVFAPETRRIWVPVGGGTSAVTSDSDIRWTVLSALMRDADLRWSLLSALSRDADLQWRVLNSTQADATLQWDLLSAALRDADFRFSVLAAIQADADLRWSVLSEVLTAARDADLRWAVLQSCEQDDDLRWGVLAAIASDADLRWRLLSLVERDTDLRWAVLRAIFNDADLRWEVLSEILTAARNAELRWSVLSEVARDGELRWSLLAEAMRSLDARWATLTDVLADADLRWRLAIEVARTADLRWTVLAETGADFTAEWSLLAETGDTVTLQWRVAGPPGAITAPIEVLIVPAEGRILVVPAARRRLAH